MGKHSKTGTLYVGTSGWSYDWENFYPDGLKRRDYLCYYSSRFRTVEVNYSFYRLPRPSTYEKWVSETSDDFLFAIKLSRFISHVKKLSGVKTALKKFLTNAKALGPKLGPILVQLPPSYRIDLKKLEQFLIRADQVRSELSMSATLRLAFEFRHRSWFEEPGTSAVTDTLKQHRAALVFGHSSRYPYPDHEPITTGFIYLRYHGPKEMFASRYGRTGLKRWRPKISEWLGRGVDVYAYFNNDVHGYAVGDANTLFDLVNN